jgi:hypothetical protein
MNGYLVSCARRANVRTVPFGLAQESLVESQFIEAPR